MASRTITTLTDDIDGGDADETVTFSFKGTQYEIDLSKKNVDKMVKALQPYTSAARGSGGRRSGPAGLPAAAPIGTSWRRSASGPAPTAIRSLTAAASAPLSKRPTTPPTKTITPPSRPARLVGWQALPPSSRRRLTVTNPTPVFNCVTPDNVKTRCRTPRGDLRAGAGS